MLAPLALVLLRMLQGFLPAVLLRTLSTVEAVYALAVAGTGAALVAWSVAGFAVIPLQQYRLIGDAPGDANTVLSFNASAVYLGQGAGAAVGSLALVHGSPASLG